MGQAALVDALVASGEKLVRALDAARYPPSAALWLFQAESADWTLVLASPVFDQLGPTASYVIVHGLLTRAPDPFDPLEFQDVSVVSTTASALKRFSLMVRTDSDAIARFRLRGNVVNGVALEDALVYRLVPPTKAAASA